MAGPTPVALDPVSVAALILTAAFGPHLSPVAAPYAVILLSASTGASWALTRREPGPRFSAAWFVLRINLSAVLLTWLIAEALRQWKPDLTTLWLLAPVSLLIGAIGDDWLGIGRWAVAKLRRVIDGRSEDKQ